MVSCCVLRSSAQNPPPRKRCSAVAFRTCVTRPTLKRASVRRSWWSFWAPFRPNVGPTSCLFFFHFDVGHFPDTHTEQGARAHAPAHTTQRSRSKGNRWSHRAFHEWTLPARSGPWNPLRTACFEGVIAPPCCPCAAPFFSSLPFLPTCGTGWTDVFLSVRMSTHAVCRSRECKGEDVEGGRDEEGRSGPLLFDPRL